MSDVHKKIKYTNWQKKHFQESANEALVDMLIMALVVIVAGIIGAVVTCVLVIPTIVR
jgi:hypothetical protein